MKFSPVQRAYGNPKCAAGRYRRMLSAKTPPRGLRGEENIAISPLCPGSRIRLFQQRPVSARRMEYAIDRRRAIDAAANSLSVMAFAERGPTRSLWNRTISSHAEERMDGLGMGIQLVEHRTGLVDGMRVRSRQALSFRLEDLHALVEAVGSLSQSTHGPEPFSCPKQRFKSRIFAGTGLLTRSYAAGIFCHL